MSSSLLFPDYEILRDPSRCVKCRVCERQCANEVHRFDEDLNMMLADEDKCVDCLRCVTLCPTRALKIRENEQIFRPNANWRTQTIKEVYRQADSGAVLLSSHLLAEVQPLP